MEDSSKKAFILGEMKVPKAFWTLSVPAVLTMMAKAIYSAVDTIYIGQLDNLYALAAVGVVGPILLILQSFETMIAQGVCVLVGRKLGENKRDDAEWIFMTSLYTTTVIGIVCCLLGIIFMNPLLRLFGAEDLVLPYGRQYGLWIFIGIIFSMPTGILNNTARGESAVRVASRGTLVGTLLNVVLDPIFIFDFGLGLGVAGASLATAISELVSLLYVAAYFFLGKSMLRIRRDAVKHTKELYFQIISIGLPVAAFQFLLSVAAAVTNNAMSDLSQGEAYVAAYSVVQKMVWIIIFVFLGLVQGFQPIVTYAAGAGNGERFRETLHYAGRVMLVTALVFALICAAFGEGIVGLFSVDEEVIEAGRELIISQTILSALIALCFVVIIAFQALGSGIQGVILAVLRQLVLYIPLMIVLPDKWGFGGVLAVQPICEVVTFSVAAVMGLGLRKRIDAMCGSGSVEKTEEQ